MAVEAEDIKKDLIRFLLEQVKSKQLSKERALGFLKNIDNMDKTATAEDVAIIGISCRFPDADNKEEFWSNLVDGKLSIQPFPQQRHTDLQAIDNGQSALFNGGFLKSVDEFDCGYFNIAPAIAQRMDPYHRLFLMTLIEAIEDAGYHRGELNGKNVGVFAGNDHTHRLFNSYLNFIDEPDFNAITGSWTGIFASRLSYLLNLKGPAIVVDTSCSSGLVALDCAVKALQSGDCESALVGAANIFFAPGKGIVGDIENDDFRVRAFDQKASGTAWGEGVAAIMVKTLSAAKRDGDTVYGIIKGIAVNNDGASNGITAPNAKAQQDVILKAWEKAGINPENISYIESHGTGTHLGDPIEIKGLMGAFSRFTKRKQFCGLGSVKTNIGHTVGVAGLASLIKVTMGLQHRKLPPTINFNIPNLFIDFCNSPVFVNDELCEWQSDGLRSAGVSSFSLSGTNCHLVIQEHEQSVLAEEEGAFLFPVSARNEFLLTKILTRYLQFIEKNNSVRLIDLCATASVGREHHTHRIAFISNSLDDLKSQIENALASSASQKTNEYTNKKASELDKLARDITSLETQQTPATLTRLLNLYQAGAAIEWNTLFSKQQWRRVHLPSQPFLTERFWDKTKKPVTVAENNVGQSANETSSVQAELDLPTLLHIITSEPERFINTPLNATDEQLAHQLVAYVVCEVLGYSSIKWSDDYYALGGDSISATRIIHIINELCGVQVALSELLSAASLGEFSEKIVKHYHLVEKISGSTTTSKNTPASNDITVLPQADSYALSRAQKRMYLLSAINPDATVYNVNSVVAMQQLPDIHETNLMLSQLLARHEILRTSFSMTNGEAIQQVHSKVDFKTELHDLRDCTAQSFSTEFPKLIQKFIRPFDLSKPPLLRLGFVMAPENQYYMLIDMHHIITDGSSMGILISDYLRTLAGENIAPLAVQYKDFSAWHNQHLQSDVYKNHAAYWQNKFDGEIPVCELPTDFPRPALQQFSGGKIHVDINKELKIRLQQFAATHSASLFVVLLAAFRVLLFKYRAGTDIVIGTPVAGRNHPQLHNIIGMFVNTLALREQLDPQDSFSHFVKKVKQHTLEDLDHQDYPYEDLVESLSLERDPGRNPLFDIYFVLQNEDMGLDHDDVKTFAFDSGIAKFDLTLIHRETPDSIAMEWEFANSLFEKNTIERMANHYLALLDAVCANPATPVATINWINPQELDHLLHDVNKTQTDYPKHYSVPALFEQQAARRPNAIAVQYAGQQLTYAELNERANQLAHYLIEHQFHQQDFIALYFYPALEMVIAILAVLKTGCAYIPLDPENPDERNQGILEDSGAVLLLTQSTMLSTINHPHNWSVNIKCIDQLPLENYPSYNPDIPVTGDDLIYVMYTSGTTGKPKGTLLRHKSIVRVVCDTNYITLDENDVCLLLASYAFDGCVLDLYGALLNGSRLLIVPKKELLDLPQLGELIEREKVTSLFATTAFFNVLVDNQLEKLVNVRQLMFGGEAASIKHLTKAFAQVGPGRLINGYGPTETAVFATTYTVNDVDAIQEFIPIGRPIANTAVYILDNYLQPVPKGVVGELYIGGDGVALGYLNQPAMTAERFIENPFCDGDRLYKTGDLVKWLPDDSIQYMGRIDHQVKIRGFRIEVDEIKETISKIDGINDCIVMVKTDDVDTTNSGSKKFDAKQSSSKKLIAYIVVDNKNNVDIEMLRSKLRQQLPEYMVPTSIVALEEFPLTNNGKVDRRKLPEPERVQFNRIAASTQIESTLITVWQDILGLAEIGINENFFSLGGDSIRGIQVIARLQEYGLQLQMGQLFQYQTIAEVAPHVISAQSTAQQGLVTGNYPLNPIQQWFFTTQENDLDHFNQSMFIHMDEIPDINILEQALVELCTQHDALRSRFTLAAQVNEKQQWLANISDDATACFVIHEWHAENWQLTDELTNAHLMNVQKSLNIVQGVNLCVGVFRSGKQQALCIAIHHLVVDVVSWGILLEDFQTILSVLDRADSTQSSAPKKYKTHSIIDWNNALVEHAHQPETIASLPYWLDMVYAPQHAICPAHLPAGTLLEAELSTQVIEKNISAAVMDAANHAFNTEPQHLLLSALSLVIYKWKHISGTIINLELHGRNLIHQHSALDIARTVGWFTLAFPFRLNVHNDYAELIKNLKESLRSVPGKGRDYGLLAYVNNAIADEEREQLQALQPQIGFNFLGAVDSSTVNTSVIPLNRTLTNSAAMKQHLALDIVVSYTNGQLMIESLFDSSRITSAEITLFGQLFEQQLALLVDYCLQRETHEKTASDFTATALQQNELDAIFEDLDVF